MLLRFFCDALRRFVVPSVDETERKPPTISAANEPDLRDFAMLKLHSRSRVKNFARCSFIAHFSSIQVKQEVESGGHNEYQDARGTPGWKSTIECLSVHQTSHAASQHLVMDGHQRNDGSGDTIWLGPHAAVWGCNDDRGDEGC